METETKELLTSIIGKQTIEIYNLKAKVEDNNRDIRYWYDRTIKAEAELAKLLSESINEYE
jgi:hypothetical protein